MHKISLGDKMFITIFVLLGLSLVSRGIVGMYFAIYPPVVPDPRVTADKFQPNADHAIVAERNLVKLQNGEEVRNANRVGFGRSGIDACYTQVGGRLEIVGRGENEYLVKYEVDEGNYGIIECPSGVIFSMPKDEFEQSTAKYRAMRAQETKAAAETDRLLRENKTSQAGS